MKRSLLVAVWTVLAASLLLVTPGTAAAGPPTVTTVLEGRDGSLDRATVVLIGNRVSKFKDWQVIDDVGTNLGSAELIMKSGKIIALRLPASVEPGNYTLRLVWNRGNVNQPITITGGNPLPGSVMADTIEGDLRTDLDDAETLGGHDAAFFRDAGNVNAGMLGTGFFDAYADLVAEGRIGVATGQVAHGDHEHEPTFTESELQDPGTLNAPGNPVHWTRLAGVPAALADGGDSNTTYSAGDGILLDDTVFSARYGGNGTSVQLSRADHEHDDDYATRLELKAGGTINTSSNPVHWTKLVNVPSGFADGVDDDTDTTYTAGAALTLTGTRFDVDLGTGSSEAAAGDHAHDDLYVEQTGDSMTGALSITTGNSVALSASVSSATAVVHGQHNGAGGQVHGVRGDTASTAGSGVSGFASAASGSTYGVRGEVDSTSGRAVYGAANATTGTNYGLYGETESVAGTAVFGTATASSGTTYGGRFEADSPDGRGVYGFADAASGTNYGGYFETESASGRGVYGAATRQQGTSYGGYFETLGTTGRGVYGFADAPTGENYGGYFESDSSTGRGVFGSANAATGSAYGGHFETDANAGRGVYGFADASSGTTYGGYFESDSSSGRGVFGIADNTSGENFGGYFEGHGTVGTGVYAVATSASSASAIGVSGEARSADGRGVVGANTATTGASVGVWGETGSTAGTGVLGYVPHSGATTDAEGVLGLNDGTAGAGVRGRGESNTGVHFGVNGTCDSSNSLSAGVFAQSTRNGGTALIAENQASNGNIAVFRTGVSSYTNHHTFDTSGDSVQTGTSYAVSHSDTSDLRLKQDVAPLTGVLERLGDVRTVSYRFKDRGDGVSAPHIGVIAQEAQSQFPELVSERPDGFLSVSYGGLAAISLQAVKELQARVEAQAKEIERLAAAEGRVAELEDRLARLEALLTESAQGAAATKR